MRRLTGALKRIAGGNGTRNLALANPGPVADELFGEEGFEGASFSGAHGSRFRAYYDSLSDLEKCRFLADLGKRLSDEDKFDQSYRVLLEIDRIARTTYEF